MKSQNKLQILINLFGRFSLIGIMSTVIYFILANLFILSGAMPPMLASSLAFIVTIPISYFGHGNFTFQIKNTNKAQLKRYLIYVVFGFVCSNLIMYLSSRSNYLNAYIGVIIITVLFPMINFLALKFLVFSKND